MANAMKSIKAGPRNVITSVAVETLNGTTVVLSAANNGPIGGKIYTASARVVTTNASQTITMYLYGSLDGTGYFKLSDLEGSDLTTNRTLASGTASTVIGVFDLRNYHAIPYFKMAASAASTCTATVSFSMVL